MDKKLKKIREEKKKLAKELELSEIELQKVLDKLDPDFDKKLECLLKTPPLKLKDLKEQLKKEREGKRSS